MKNQKWAVLFFAVFLFTGFRMATDSWKGILYVYLGEERSPAAVHHLKDFSRLDAKALSRAAHDEVIANAEIVRHDSELGVRLGHFLTRTADGRREFACRVENREGVYDRVSMTFMGLGIAEQGEMPSFTVDADCKSSADLDWLETVWIPMDEIAKSNNGVTEQMGFGNEHVSVELQHLLTEWPETWMLTKVRLYHSSNPDDSLVVDAATLKPEIKSKFTFDWKKPTQQMYGP